MRFPCLVLDHDDTVVQSEMTVNFPYFLQVLNAFRPGQTTTAEEYARECNRVGFADFCRQRFHFTEQEILDGLEGIRQDPYSRSVPGHCQCDPAAAGGRGEDLRGVPLLQ